METLESGWPRWEEMVHMRRDGPHEKIWSTWEDGLHGKIWSTWEDIVHMGLSAHEKIGSTWVEQ